MVFRSGELIGKFITLTLYPTSQLVVLSLMWIRRYLAEKQVEAPIIAAYTVDDVHKDVVDRLCYSLLMM